MAGSHATDPRSPASRTGDDAHLLMRSGVPAHCADCGDEGLFVPVDDHDRAGSEYCCTRCDAAVFLFEVLGGTTRADERVSAASA